MNSDLRMRLEKMCSGGVVFDCGLARYSSFAIGGPADALVVVSKYQELTSLLPFLDAESVAWRVIGKGSNLLIDDEGFRGVVIILGGEFAEIATADHCDNSTISLRVGAGCSLTKLNHHCCRKGYNGLAFSYGIPGSVGGAVLMNAGAWGKELSSVLTEVGVITALGYEKLTGDQLDFSYRYWPYFSTFERQAVIVDALFSLTAGDSKLIEHSMKELLQKRKNIQPHNYPNGGSCFKNPAEKSAGQLIEECGLKGMSIGGAKVSEKHANFIINYKKATAADVLSLMERVQREVYERFDVNLEPELHLM
ncbi:UDP-N-acetylmuramate dehydrogenase [Desulforhopalus sp. 52FAK]